jgi:N-terminal domain of anti-restriction factor ArdC
MSPPRLSIEERQDRVRARVELAQQVLLREVERLQSGEDWRSYLAFQAALHSYSPRNVMLLAAQHARAYAEGRVSAPEATYVAGFRTWRALGRSVNKGQKGYAVLAPIRYDRRYAVDPEGRTRPLGRGDQPERGESVTVSRALRGFKVEFVFDVSQTSGVELARPPRPKLLVGEAPAGLGRAVSNLIQSRGYRVGTVEGAAAIDGANGVTDWVTRTVLIRADMDDAAMVRTLIHEAAHVLLHETPPGQLLSRSAKEVEAESVAFVVSAAHGMATDEYSFPYVATWAGADGTKALLATQDRVAQAARRIIATSSAPQFDGGRVLGVEAAMSVRADHRAAPVEDPLRRYPQQPDL